MYKSSALSLRERVAEGRVRVANLFRRTTLTRASRTLSRREGSAIHSLPDSITRYMPAPAVPLKCQPQLQLDNAGAIGARHLPEIHVTQVSCNVRVLRLVE